MEINDSDVGHTALLQLKLTGKMKNSKFSPKMKIDSNEISTRAFAISVFFKNTK